MLVIDCNKALSSIYGPSVFLSTREPFAIEMLEYFDRDVSAYSSEIPELGDGKWTSLSQFEDVFFYELKRFGKIEAVGGYLN